MPKKAKSLVNQPQKTPTCAADIKQTTTPRRSCRILQKTSENFILPQKSLTGRKGRAVSMFVKTNTPLIVTTNSMLTNTTRDVLISTPNKVIEKCFDKEDTSDTFIETSRKNLFGNKTISDNVSEETEDNIKKLLSEETPTKDAITNINNILNVQENTNTSHSEVYINEVETISIQGSSTPNHSLCVIEDNHSAESITISDSNRHLENKTENKDCSINSNKTFDITDDEDIAIERDEHSPVHNTDNSVVGKDGQSPIHNNDNSAIKGDEHSPVHNNDNSVTHMNSSINVENNFIILDSIEPEKHTIKTYDSASIDSTNISEICSDAINLDLSQKDSDDELSVESIKNEDIFKVFPEKNTHRISIVDLTDSPIPTTKIISNIMEEESISPNSFIKSSQSLLCTPETDNIIILNNTLSPNYEIDNDYKTEDVNSESDNQKVNKRIITTLSQTPINQKTKKCIIKTPASVKRLKNTPLRRDRTILNRELTPFKRNESTPIMKTKIKHESISKQIAKNTPLITHTLNLTTHLKSIRKRSFSVTDIDEKSKKNNRVTFHSPLNQEIPIKDIDIQMEVSVRKEQIRESGRRKRSFSNAEIDKDKVHVLRELKKSNQENTGSSSSKVSKSKLPDFASIHKKNFNKMESIVEYANRKIERSKNMRSGNKSGNKATVKKPVDEAAEPKAKISLFFDNQQKRPNWESVRGQAVASIVEQNKAKPSNKVLNRQHMYKKRPETNINEQIKQRSHVIKGVRSNRRFDLQMQFRKNIDDTD